ncbi:tail fiber domain-containing protein [Changchengzhania lutea]|uniref:tail fiber domain-containing protein n=1 Tax=Changchengzhania lutea TaxID=2049305 RepID=UPI00163DD672|nr:tail fiber domain-containing protein [Changchengzhania lutea]
MKITHLLLGFMLFFFVQQNYGQIQVNSTGKVGIGNYAPNNSYSITAQTSFVSNLNINYGYVYESIGIGTSYNSSYKLYVRPNQNYVTNAVRISDGSYGTSSYTLYVSGDAYVSEGVFTSSDKRLKKDERIIEKDGFLAKLRKVRGKKYKYKTRDELLEMHNAGTAKFPLDTIYKVIKKIKANGEIEYEHTDEIDEIVVDVPKFDEGEQYGVAAQEVMTEFPELVSLDETTGLYGVNYQGFVPLLLEAFNIQQEKIAQLEVEISNLKITKKNKE